MEKKASYKMPNPSIEEEDGFSCTIYFSIRSTLILASRYTVCQLFIAVAGYHLWDKKSQSLEPNLNNLRVLGIFIFMYIVTHGRSFYRPTLRCRRVAATVRIRWYRVKQEGQTI